MNDLRGGIVLTGGGASLVNFANLFKEVSGYEVRIGFPRHLFSASVGAGVYNPSATAAVGMVLAAKDDRLPDCITRPESPAWSGEAASAGTGMAALVDTGGDTGTDSGYVEPFTVPDAKYEEGEQGSLDLEVEPAPEETQPAAEKPHKQKKPAEPRRPKMVWIKALGEKVKSGVLNFYDEMTRDEDAEEVEPKNKEEK